MSNETRSRMNLWLREPSEALGPVAENPLVDLCLRNRRIVGPLDYDMRTIAAPYDMLNLAATGDLLAAAIQEGKRIVVVSDYDTDGATAAAVSIEGLGAFGANIDFVVPNRISHGYGLTPDAVDLALAKNPDIIMTVDNGISSLTGADHLKAQAKHVDLVITDHHLPPNSGILPPAAAIVNPNQTGCAFASKNLCGCGVAWYVVGATRRALIDRGHFTKSRPPPMGSLLDLVALATVADVVPLDHNNRTLIEAGLGRINSPQCRPGIRALLQVANRAHKQATTADLAFAVAPRLNAAGRLDDMTLGIRCLLETRPERAIDLASNLDFINAQRREIEADMVNDAFALLESADGGSSQYISCLYQAGWHEGVVGILASRVKEKRNHPAICFADSSISKTGDREIKGSARSVPQVHIKHMIDAVAADYPGMLLSYGGHAMAAGLHLRHRDLHTLEAALDQKIQLMMRPEDLAGGHVIDAAHQPDLYTLENAEALQHAGPWGQFFEEPLFADTFTVLNQHVMQDKHIRFTLCSSKDPSKTFQGVAFHAFRNPADIHTFDGEIHAVFRLNVNEWQGERRLQLMFAEFHDTAECDLLLTTLSDLDNQRPAVADSAPELQ